MKGVQRSIVSILEYSAEFDIETDIDSAGNLSISVTISNANDLSDLIVAEISSILNT